MQYDILVMFLTSLIDQDKGMLSFMSHVLTLDLTIFYNFFNTSQVYFNEF